MKTGITNVKAENQAAVSRSVDEEETYWFLRWVVLKRKYDQLKNYMIELQKIDVVKLKEENNNLKNSLQVLKKRHEQLKNKKHNGRTEKY
jgi:signal-transduction protein with cAMP-binding, CBS, and nucleotidyltransferase domain